MLRSVIARLSVAVLPLAISVALAWLLAGPLSFGGGEKDVLLALPLIAFSLLFLLLSIVLWWRRLPLMRATVLASTIAAAGLAAIATAFLFVTLN